MVTVGSNFEGTEPLDTAKTSRRTNFYLPTICPQYEVVLHDWPLFLYYLEVSLYKLWLLYPMFEKDYPFLEHVQSIANSYLNLHQNDRRVFKTEEIMFRNSHVAKRVDPAVRFDGKKLFIGTRPL